jgi:tRNA pseudouridine55 synthase
MVITLYKPQGLTPLEAIGAFRIQSPEYEGVPLTYAGRLDPMAEGLLLLLSGSDIKDKEKYLDMDKTYQVEFLLGFSTDSYDLLGITQASSAPHEASADIEQAIQNLKGSRQLPVPPYSSKPVGGKPLFMWAREERLSEIEIPYHEASVLELSYLGKSEMSGEKLLVEITERIGNVGGDFRQAESLKSWEHEIDPSRTYALYKLSLKVTSGTYIRSIIHHLGKDLGVGACIFSLTRTSIGLFSSTTAKPI